MIISLRTFSIFTYFFLSLKESFCGISKAAKTKQQQKKKKKKEGRKQGKKGRKKEEKKS